MEFSFKCSKDNWRFIVNELSEGVSRWKITKILRVGGFLLNELTMILW